MGKSRDRVLRTAGLVAAVAIVATWLGFFMAKARRGSQFALEWQDLQQLTRALKAYAAEHQGAMPESLDDMVQSGFAEWKGRGRELFVFFPLMGSGEQRGQGSVSDPDRFDVAFGVKASEVAEIGHVKTDAGKRYLILPPSESRLTLKTYWEESGNLAKAMREAAGYRPRQGTDLSHAP